jgi:Hus1-like protein
MKFRARLTKESVLTIHSVSSTLQRIGSTACIFLNEECIQIAVITESADMPKCYSVLDPKALFPAEYRIESQSGNTILFEIGLLHLSKALESGRNATDSQFKLVKRGMTPCLCYEAKDSDSLAVSRNLSSVIQFCCDFFSYSIYQFFKQTTSFFVSG